MARVTPINEAWKECPRADECSCNDCPLTLKNYQSDPSDPQPKCTFGKTGRMRIGKKWNLTNHGLKSRELASYNNWHNQPEEVKQAKLEQLRSKSAILRLDRAGYKISRKKRIVSGLHGINGQNTLNKASEGRGRE